MFGTTNTGFPGSTQFTNVSVTFSLQSTPDYADYPYRATYSNSAVTSNTFASVIYSGSQTSTGYYASFCSTFDGGVYLYATSDVGTIIVPTISIGMYSSGLNIDETVTPNSKALITSGAVATAMAPVDLTSQITVDTNQGTFNTGYSSVVRSGNTVVVTIGGSNIGSSLSGSYYLYNLPKAYRTALAPIYDFAKQKMLGYFSILSGETTLRATTYDSGVNVSVTCQIIYITDEVG